MALRGDRVHDLRQTLGFSQRELADKLGLRTQQIIRYEKGENDPTAHVLAGMAIELQTTADYLIGLTDDPSDHRGEAGLSVTENRLISLFRAKDTNSIIKLLAETISSS